MTYTEHISLPREHIDPMMVHFARTRDGRWEFRCYQLEENTTVTLGAVGCSRHEVWAALDEYRRRLGVVQSLSR
jgi:hypothetical protein